MNYQYKIVPVSTASLDETTGINTEFNTLGAAGWLLVCIYGGYAYFQKPA